MTNAEELEAKRKSDEERAELEKKTSRTRERENTLL